MLQRIAGVVIAVAGIFFAFVVGLSTLVFLGLVAAGAAVAHGFRMRGAGRGKGWRRDVIEGEFTVVDDKAQGAGQQDQGRSDNPPAP